MSSKASDPRDNQRRRRSRSPSQLLKSGKKSIKGLWKGSKGKSKKKKNITATPAASSVSSTAQSISNFDPDDATVYNVELDASTKPLRDLESIAAPTVTKASNEQTVTSNGKNTPIQTILFLMNETRFELIQFSFDAASASLKDILNQIPLTATEDSLRTQTYKTVCLSNGVTMSEDDSLESYLGKPEGKQSILFAIPDGMTAEQCLKISTPILENAKVKKMLKGVDVPVNTKSIIKPEESLNTPETTLDSEKEEIQQQEDLSTLPQLLTESSKDEISDSIENKVEVQSEVTGTLWLIVVFISILIPIMFSIQAHITSPLSPGDSLPVGHWRSTCGMLTIFPENISGCTTNKILEMKDNGILTFYEVNGELDNILWQMTAKCPNEGECAAFVGQDGAISIGDVYGTVVKTKGKKKENTVTLAPWPFTKELPSKTKRK